MAKRKHWSRSVVESLADALTAYLTLQARTGMSPAYSEYLLYDPIVRVCKSRRWEIFRRGRCADSASWAW